MRSRSTRALRALADAAGILSEYVAVGGERRRTSDAARRAILTALGIDVSSERAVAGAVDALRRKRVGRLLEPVAVVPSAPGRAEALMARVPRGVRGVPYQLDVVGERGEHQSSAGRLRTAAGTPVRIPLAAPLTPGYYRARLEVGTAAGAAPAEQFVIVPPSRCPQPGERLGRNRAFGLTVNLYTLRSERNWGVGDISDLAALASWGAERGAAFVGINPLHALLNHDEAVSPYSPVSRLFRNPLYLDPEAVPAFAECREAQAWLAAADRRDALERLRRTDRIEYAAVMALKRPVLEALHRCVVARSGSLGATPAGEGRSKALTAFATYLAVAERFGPDWRAWPANLRRHDDSAVASFRREHAVEIDFHCWVQAELDRQLGAAAGAAGLEIGLMGDLAIGTAPEGADTWMAPELFVAGARLGAPPDAYHLGGQDWGLAPLDPRALSGDRFGYWIQLLRSALRHMGALRLDHVMGLFRQFWIPPGGRPADGAYVRYPAEPLLAVLAVESARAGAVIVGEDLGTVPRGLTSRLRRWGILSTRVLYFERKGVGFRPARHYSRRALVTANTHDQVPLAGYWTGRDLELLRAVGSIKSERALAAARAVRGRDRRALVRRLAAEHLAPEGGEYASTGALVAAVHSFLGRTPAPLLGLSLADLVGETEPVNMPGVGLDRYPSWQRRLAPTLEWLTTEPTVRRALGDQRQRVRPGRWLGS